MESANKAQQELGRIEQQIEQLERLAGQNQEAQRKLQQLHERVHALRQQIHAQLNAWEKTELARHPQRPNLLEYVERIFTDWSEIHGDRAFSDDPAIICGMARFNGDEVLVLGHQKARDTREKVYRNFGMANPEGYRKALRVMRLAEKFGRPIFSFVDTPGAYPGVGAEERGQAEAIARSTDASLRLGVPNVAVIIGEGGSGGAIAIASTNRVLMLEHAIYSVISPEGAASILWRDTAKAQEAATGMRITADDMMRFGIIDQIVTEPPGGAHRDPAATIASTGEAIANALAELAGLDRETVRRLRREKFLAIGRTLA
jgi:acetyl-CoA carboxylase carboxyl transferase subunit alpha